MSQDIPFNKPFVIGKELYYISEAVRNGHLSGDGEFTKKCHTLLENYLSVQKVLLTHSCTAALEMAAILCDVGPEDEVILPSYTFVSTANAFFLRGAKLKFVDVDPLTLNIDPNKISEAITKKTKVIAPVHYAGVGADMDAIMDVANKSNSFVVEDAAQALGANYNGKPLGTIGHLGTFSFHETKNIISGEGGALAINDEQFIERAEIIREKGTNRNKFFRGEVDKYTWVDVGSSYLPSELVAAFLYAQLERIDEINAERKRVYVNYLEGLSKLENEGIVTLPKVPAHCEQNYHLFFMILDTAQTRDALINHLRSKNIKSVFHYVPLHLSPVGRSMGYQDGDLPVTEDLSSRLVRLPLFYNLTIQEQEKIISEIYSFFGK